MCVSQWLEITLYTRYTGVDQLATLASPRRYSGTNTATLLKTPHLHVIQNNSRCAIQNTSPHLARDGLVLTEDK